MVGDEAQEATPGASITQIDRGLTGCHGVASTSVPGDDRYVLTTFGGPGDHQSMSCGGYADGTTWYAASRQRYGCGAKLQIEANGACVVVEALDYGPDVCVENAAGRAIIDASPLVGRALFDEAGVGYSDQKIVTVTEVAQATPLGPCGAAPTGGGGTTSAASCASSTLGRDVADGTCMQSADDAQWYTCDDGQWVSRASDAGCDIAYGFCYSPTLGIDVAPRSCVQAQSNGTWYQCNGQAWVSPVDTAARTGALGDCSDWYPL
jgi:hypothetical protein